MEYLDMARGAGQMSICWTRNKVGQCVLVSRKMVDWERTLRPWKHLGVILNKSLAFDRSCADFVYPLADGIIVRSELTYWYGRDLEVPVGSDGCILKPQCCGSNR